MTREIKFRAWHKNWGSFANLKEDSDFMAGFNEEGQIFIINNGYPDEKNRDFVIQQFTGLKDKHGKEIYEGDIVKMYFDKDKISNWLYASFSNEILKNGFFFETVEIPECYSKQFPDEFEVIGNIFENPQLLKDK